MGRWDVAVVGGGVLGTTIAYWLASRFEGRIVVIEREDQVASHASGRNTGVIHRPFYLHPQERRLFAKAASLSFPLWKTYASVKGLPWAETGTLKVAVSEDQVRSLEKNVEYAMANGMDPFELELLDSKEVARMEPEVKCVGALLVKTDTTVDFKKFTQALRQDAESMGVDFLTRTRVVGVDERGEEPFLLTNSRNERISSRLIVNCAGGNAVDVAHMFGLAGEYADMHFRGEYWAVDGSVASVVKRNVYCVPRQGEFPFLDPHWIVRVDGRREIGPNAVPVPGPTVYEGIFRNGPGWASDLFQPPTWNKLRIWLNRDFVSLSIAEMWSSLSRNEMLRRVSRFIPRLKAEHLRGRVTAGVRSVVIDKNGRLGKEAIELQGENSFHVLNFNSPGATGAPAYSAHVVRRLQEGGRLDQLRERSKPLGVWDWEKAI